MKRSVRQFVHRSDGFSLVELLVTIVIALLASLAVFGVLSSYEAKKRTTTFVNDAVQSGNFGMFYLDKQIRQAGSGFAQSWQAAYGCKLYGYNSAAGNSTLFPTSALPTEFTQVQNDTGGNFVLAPVLIDSTGEASGSTDSLIVMSGNAGNGEYPVNFTAIASGTTSLPLTNTLAFNPNDVLLLIDAPGATQAACMLTQVNSSFVLGTNLVPPANLPLAGTFYKASFGPNPQPQITSYSKNAVAIDLGNPTSDSPPSFELLGVNTTTNTLVDYPLLSSPTASQQVADGVLELHALYGVDEAGTGQITNWVPASGTWALSNLITQLPGATGSPGSGAYLLERIKAIRIGLILRTNLPENTKNPTVAITPGPLTLFSDLGAVTPGLTYTRTLSTAEQGFRYRTVEATIPVRNNILIAQ